MTKTKAVTTTTGDKALTPVDTLKKLLDADSVKQQFKNALEENAPLFVASLIDIYASDTTLQGCNPSLVIMEALKAATLKLPINKSLGIESTITPVLYSYLSVDITFIGVIVNSTSRSSAIVIILPLQPGNTVGSVG